MTHGAFGRDPADAGEPEPDPFGTAAVRERVLAGWRAAAVRFREDANAEEDLALGGYRDRLVVELAQNAADAAARAGVPGRLLLRLTELPEGPVLVAANTGDPLDAAGVEALSTLRASAKRDDDTSVGRFGVGFAAVLAVTDEPAVLSRHGGVRFSAADTRDLVVHPATDPATELATDLAAELARRDGHVPVLRLPFPAGGTPPAGYDTAVVLPLRDAVAEDLVGRLLAQVDDPLLLALPALAEVVVEVPGAPSRTVAGVADRWHVVRRSGRLDAALLADRPTEERSRTAWSLTWALPAAVRPGAGPVAVQEVAPTWPAVVHAPTPSDEPLAWPALLVATLPLDPARRHVAPGPATDALVGQAAAAYAELLEQVAVAGRTPWELVPVGLPAGVLDGALREAVLRLLPGTAFLVGAQDPAVPLRPRDAVALDPPAGADEDVVAALAPTVAGLVVLPRGARPAADTAGVRRTALADVVELLPTTGDPAQLRDLYAALAPLAADPDGREALAALPVPLADGRTVRGARGTVLPGGPPQVAAALAALGARAVHPDAAHPLLERLGAAAATPRTAIDLPQVRAAVAAALDDKDDGGLAGPGDDPDRPDVAGAVLTVVAAAVADGTLAAGDLPWLGDVLLRDDDGEPAPARELVLPGSPAQDLLDPDAVGTVHADLVATWGPQVLVAAGVLDGVGVLRAADVPLDPDPGAADDDPGSPAARLDGWDRWCEEVLDRVGAAGGDARVADLAALTDLDVVAPGAWPRLLAAVGSDPALRAAVADPVTVLTGDGRAVRVASYTAWWLRGRLAARCPWADPDAAPAAAAVLPAAPAGPDDVDLRALDPLLRAALGAVRDLDGLDAGALGAVLGRLADPAVRLDAATALRLWGVLAGLAAAADGDPDGPDVDPPAAVRVLDGIGTRVVAAGRAAVVTAPQHLQPGVLGAAGVDGAVVVTAGPDAAEALADLLDVPLAADVVRGEVDEAGDAAGERAEVPDAVVTLLAAAPGDVPATWCEHDLLRVDGADVDWWLDDAGTVHACTLDGLAAGLAAAARAWTRRASVAAVLADPAAAGRLLADDAFG